ncbi:unnamed protein product [Camellia sinensis]
MGCSFSGLNALYDAVNGGGDVWINENHFRILRQLGEGGFAYVFLVKEVLTESAAASGDGIAKKLKDPSRVSDDGTYAMKKVLVLQESKFALVQKHYNCKNGHLSTVRHLSEHLNCGIAQAMQILMKELISGH